jgi:hypothetical protein
MWVLALFVVVLAGAGVLAWSRGAGRHLASQGFNTSPRAIELLHASVAAVPANSFDARLRIGR